jgi:hypothetical protein
MQYAAHEARMRQPADKEGKVSTRTALKATAARGVVSAVKLLAGPPFPESVAYLWDWFMELDRSRTYGMGGPDPLTYQAIDAWARLTDRHPAPHEVEALFSLDLVSRHPDAIKEVA